MESGQVRVNPDFKVYFNKKRQWAEVFLWSVHPNTFQNWQSGRWGYWIAEYTNPLWGKFGSLHFVKSRLRTDTISHEIDHMRAEWVWINRNAWTGKNEEKLIEFKDDVYWRFLRELCKVEPRARVWMKTLSEL